MRFGICTHLIVGTVRDELRSLFDSNPHWRRMRQSHAIGQRVFEWISALVGRSIMERPALRLADNHVRAGANVYRYRLHWCPPGSGLGACHVIDLPFVFGGRAAWEAAPMLGGRWDEVDALGREMRRAWTSFAHHGHPDAGATTAWSKHRVGAAVGRDFAAPRADQA